MHGRWIAVDLEDPAIRFGIFYRDYPTRVSISLHDPFDRVVFEGSTRWKKRKKKRKNTATWYGAI